MVSILSLYNNVLMIIYTVDETIDVIPSVDNDSFVIEEAQVFKRDSDEKDQFSVLSVPCLPIEGNPTSLTPKKPTPFKNMSTVSNDKENIDSGRKLPTVFVDDGKKSKKEKDESERLRSLNEISMRQLRKQVKAMTLNSLNSNEDKVNIFFIVVTFDFVFPVKRNNMET